MRILTEKDIKRQNFLTRKFKEYYTSNLDEENNPADIELREFGFFYWNLNKFVRHLGFQNVKTLKNHIISNPPKHIYCSAARYETPDASNMKAKNFIDCDLIFDLDIDHIPTPCKVEHDKWICKKCGKAGVGTSPKTCPTKNCDSNSFQDITWECEKCMEIAKSEIIFLVEEFLSDDFGLNPTKDLFIVFSGQRGYHIHVENELLSQLSTNARREIVDYVTGRGLVPSFHGFSPNANIKPNVLEKGWRGRIAQLVLKLIKESSSEELLKILTKNIDIDSARKEITAQLSSDNPSWNFKKIGEKTWYKLINFAVERYGGKIDEPVSIDLHRLIRFPGSLHGKTGFLVKKMTFKDLKEFDPFNDAQVFEGNEQIYVKEAPQFKIKNEIYGPYKDKRVELDSSAAIFLLCKGLATL